MRDSYEQSASLTVGSGGRDPSPVCATVDRRGRITKKWRGLGRKIRTSLRSLGNYLMYHVIMYSMDTSPLERFSLEKRRQKRWVLGVAHSLASLVLYSRDRYSGWMVFLVQYYSMRCRRRDGELATFKSFVRMSNTSSYNYVRLGILSLEA